MYYFDGHEFACKAKTIKELKEKIEKSNCYHGEIYRGNQLYALAKKERKSSACCSSWNEWTYEICK